jgi:hypothetical protein
MIRKTEAANTMVLIALVVFVDCGASRFSFFVEGVFRF